LYWELKIYKTFHVRTFFKSILKQCHITRFSSGSIIRSWYRCVKCSYLTLISILIHQKKRYSTDGTKYYYIFSSWYFINGIWSNVIYNNIFVSVSFILCNYMHKLRMYLTRFMWYINVFYLLPTIFFVRYFDGIETDNDLTTSTSFSFFLFLRYITSIMALRCAPFLVLNLLQTYRGYRLLFERVWACFSKTRWKTKYRSFTTSSYCDQGHKKLAKKLTIVSRKIHKKNLLQ